MRAIPGAGYKYPRFWSPDGKEITYAATDGNVGQTGHVLLPASEDLS